MKVGVIMGSVSDYEVMADAVAMLGQFGGKFLCLAGRMTYIFI